MIIFHPAFILEDFFFHFDSTNQEGLLTHRAFLQLQLGSPLLKVLQQSLGQASDRRGGRLDHCGGGGPGLSSDEGDRGQTDQRTRRRRGNRDLI